MGLLRNHGLLLLVLFLAVLSLSFPAESLDEENLLQQLNSYRTSLNLSTLTENKNANCLAEELAEQFKNQPCTNTTGADTVPGTEPQFSNYPDLLVKCHLNITNTREGNVMPACIPNLVPDLVLSNFTQSQYSEYLNDSTFSGAGIGSEDNWVVVILTKDTVGGNFSPAQNDAAGLSLSSGLARLLFAFGCFLVMLR
ncbi:uncharacterized GPI-anchored protein At5g19250-like [Impatiens glandulifera]|uniref:uncharacterized GPI-anchored protein At5g19250-like n=1 Tax=Impatiens glandulifera TaxID=253017 RepID=UPI001FB0F00F|nr:uncharacterized GPI-anchored protein At5g19250-like [Impatiens glandulifera]